MSVLGQILRGVHAGEEHLVWNAVDAASAAPIALSSPAFPAGALIPARHAGAGVGENVSPELAWSGIPADARELVVVIEDPDAPLPRPVVHAIAYGISPTATSLGDGALSSPRAEGHARGKGFLGRCHYGGPRPIPGHGPHRYVFQLFALRRPLSFPEAPSRRQLVAQMHGAVLARGRLDGLYER